MATFTDKARAIIRQRAREWPGADWHICQENDEPQADRTTGDVYISGHRRCDAVIAAICEGNGAATIVIRDPGADYQDWNDRLRGPGFCKAATAARRKAEESAGREETARVAAEEAAREEAASTEAERNWPRLT